MKRPVAMALGVLCALVLPAEAQEPVPLQVIESGEPGLGLRGVPTGDHVVRSRGEWERLGLNRIAGLPAGFRFSTHTVLAVVSPRGENARMLSVERVPRPKRRGPARSFLRVQMAGAVGPPPLGFQIISIPRSRESVEFDHAPLVSAAIQAPTTIEVMGVETCGRGCAEVFTATEGGRTYHVPTADPVQGYFVRMLLNLKAKGGLPISVGGRAWRARSGQRTFEIRLVRKTIHVTWKRIVRGWMRDEVNLGGGDGLVYTTFLSRSSAADVEARRRLSTGRRPDAVVEALLVPNHLDDPRLFDIKIVSVSAAPQPATPRAGMVQRLSAAD